ncbi:LCP family protein [Clostridium oceanicum]|uniref:LCP family protein n=1 Tax=Clostridium oceanicum TaxID=1543 RepID=A0ABN1JVI0_9CLOT
MGNKKRRSKSNKGLSRLTKVIIVLIALIILGGTLGYLYLLGFGPSKAGEGNINTKETVSGEPVNILVMGVDIGDPKSQSKNDPKRTDTIMLANYNPKTKKVNIVSIPRDTRIMLNGKHMKINAAHAVDGVNGSISAVENLLGVSINYYAKINYEGFRKVIDALGGIDMTITRNMHYDDPSQDLHIHFDKGTEEHLDGKKAEEFFRWRKNNNGTGFKDGDLGRIENQHQFINKVIAKFKSPSIVTKIPKIMSTVPDYVTTDMSPEDILKYGYIFSKLDSDKLNMTTLKGEAKYIGGVSYFVYDREKNRDLMYSIKNGDNGSGSESKSFNKENFKIKILNGTNVSGLAATYSKKLQELGYSNIVVGNGPKRETTKMIVKQGSNISASEVQSKLNINNVQFYDQTSGNFDIIVYVGKDYIK